MSTFNSKIQGIPCQIRVTYYTPDVPMHWGQTMETSYPAEDGIFEYDVLDRKGYRAKWLEKIMTDKDRARIEEDYADYRMSLEDL